MSHGVINTKTFGREAIIWNERLEVIEKRTFFQIGRRRDCDWYLEGKEAEEALNLSRQRMHIRYQMERAKEARTTTKDITSTELKKALIPAVRRHLGKPKMKAERIDKIVRTWRENHFEYIITTVGKNKVVLH